MVVYQTRHQNKIQQQYSRNTVIPGDTEGSFDSCGLIHSGFSVKMWMCSAHSDEHYRVGVLGWVVRERLPFLKMKLERQLSKCLFHFVFLSEINESFCSRQNFIQLHDCFWGTVSKCTFSPDRALMTDRSQRLYWSYLQSTDKGLLEGMWMTQRLLPFGFLLFFSLGTWLA